MSKKHSNQLGKNTAIYGGALLLPRLGAFVALIVFSRLLSPTEYGYFALLVITAELLSTVLFNWIRLAFLRLHAEQEKSGQCSVLRRTCLAMTALAMLLSLPVAAVMAMFATPDRWLTFFILLAGMNFANGVVRLRLSELQAQQRSFRYFAAELSRAVLSLGLSFAAVQAWGPNFEALGAGFVAANIAVALVCIVPYAGDLTRLTLNRPLVKSIVAYASPIILTSGIEALVPLTERYVIQFVAGPAAVGVYAAAQNLVLQPINMLGSALALAAFPIIIRSAEMSGTNAAQSRIREAGGFLLALLLPAAAGIVMLRTEIAAVVLGEEFRAQAAILMPWVAITAVLANLKYHYFDIAFHVTRRMTVLVATTLPATLLTAPLIYVFLKMYGLPGAAAGGCVAFAASVLVTWLVGRRLLAIPHAVGEIARVAAATGVMIGVLAAIGPLPQLPALVSLVLLIAAGASAYGATAIALNLLNLRTILLDQWGRFANRPVEAS